MGISIYSDRFILVYCCTLAVILGAVFGSFLNCAAWRTAHGESFLRGRSHCPSCGHELGIADLFPVISWLALGGRCRYCRTRISVRYPLTELFFAVMSVLCLLQSDLTVVCLRNYIFGCCLFFLSLVDLESMIIPDRSLLIAAAAYFVTFPFTGTAPSGLLVHVLAGIGIGGGLLVISLIMDRVLGRESMGGGDIKLLAVAGLYLGPASGMFALILACILGLVFAVLRQRRQGENSEFPFGPSIAAAVWIMLLWGTPLTEWYLGLIGL